MLTLSHIKNHVIMYTQYWDFRIKYKKVVFETKAKILCSVTTEILQDFLMTLVFWTLGWLKFLGSTYFTHFPRDWMLRSLKCVEISLRDQNWRAETPHKISKIFLCFTFHPCLYFQTKSLALSSLVLNKHFGQFIG